MLKPPFLQIGLTVNDKETVNTPFSEIFCVLSEFHLPEYRPKNRVFLFLSAIILRNPVPFVNEQERLLLHYGDMSGKDRSTLFDKFRDFFVILHKNESQFSTPVKKVPDDIF